MSGHTCSCRAWVMYLPILPENACIILALMEPENLISVHPKLVPQCFVSKETGSFTAALLLSLPRTPTRSPSAGEAGEDCDTVARTFPDSPGVAWYWPWHVAEIFWTESRNADQSFGSSVKPGIEEFEFNPWSRKFVHSMSWTVIFRIPFLNSCAGISSLRCQRKHSSRLWCWASGSSNSVEVQFGGGSIALIIASIFDRDKLFG
mmetsp:Transcript_20712/g.51388  ORF Transcript_20712/g.51388 Transcript_20712/m.51388 type:complete len:205 (+) Transcript_20712:2956-3570(+)